YIPSLTVPPPHLTSPHPQSSVCALPTYIVFAPTLFPNRSLPLIALLPSRFLECLSSLCSMTAPTLSPLAPPESSHCAPMIPEVLTWSVAFILTPFKVIRVLEVLVFTFTLFKVLRDASFIDVLIRRSHDLKSCLPPLCLSRFDG
ncbi:hypothetical protein BDQ17DRAFT_1343504, partial [Cyathus striatus]